MTVRDLVRSLQRTISRLVTPDTINAYERRRSSQNGEDGIIAEIFRRLEPGPGGRFFVEFGVSDGRECNGAALVRDGWSGLMIEGDPRIFQSLSRTYAGASGLRLLNAYVTAENIATLLRENGVPDAFDLLSIDIDGNDYLIWEALAAFRPRVVVIEYNAAHPPPERWVMAYNAEHRWSGSGYYGASLASLEAQGQRLGYALI